MNGWDFANIENFGLKKIENQNLSFDELNGRILKEVPNNLGKYESIIGESFYVNQFRFSKFIKKNLKK